MKARDGERKKMYRFTRLMEVKTINTSYTIAYKCRIVKVQSKSKGEREMERQKKTAKKCLQLTNYISFSRCIQRNGIEAVCCVRQAASAFYRTIDLWFGCVCVWLCERPLVSCVRLFIRRHRHCFFCILFERGHAHRATKSQRERPRLVKIDHHTKYRDTIFTNGISTTVFAAFFRFFSVVCPFFHCSRATERVANSKNSRIVARKQWWSASKMENETLN